MLNAVIYARLPSKGEFDFERCLYIIRKEKGALSGTFIDLCRSGYTFDRPEYRRMKESINAKKVDMVVMPSFVQFSRNISEAIKEIESMKEMGIAVFFCDIGIDSRAIDTTSESFKKILDAALEAFPFETSGEEDHIEFDLCGSMEHIEEYMGDFQVVDKSLFDQEDGGDD